MTPEGRKVTKLEQILLNGNNIAIVRFFPSFYFSSPPAQCDDGWPSERPLTPVCYPHPPINVRSLFPAVDQRISNGGRSELVMMDETRVVSETLHWTRRLACCRGADVAPEEDGSR